MDAEGFPSVAVVVVVLAVVPSALTYGRRGRRLGSCRPEEMTTVMVSAVAAAVVVDVVAVK